MPSTTVVANLRPGERLLAVGVVHAIAIDDAAVYAETSPSTTPVGPDTIVRIDRRSAKTTSSGAVLAFPGQLVRIGPWLWTNDGGMASQGGHPTELVQLDAATLAVHQRVALPDKYIVSDEYVTLAGSPSGLWVGAPSWLLRLDPETGRITSTIALPPGGGTEVATDPNGRLLYVTQANVGLDLTKPNQPYKTVVVTERDATTGAVLVTRSDLPSVAGASVAPVDTPDGVWVSFGTGMMGQVQLLRAADLATIATFSGPAAHGSPEGAAGTNSVHGTVSGGLLWVTDQIGVFSCADPGTGRLLSTREFPPPVTALISDGSTLYTATDAGLALLQPDAACKP
ncbi:MAG TPA: hypothetical protein VKA66_13190 [Mycobacterium sp.]|nr:hypothetical protein [Mycobacterium sp.]